MRRDPEASGLPRIVRYLFIHAGIGIAVGCVCAAAMLLLDVAGVGTLVAGTSTPWVPIALLFGGFSLTFGSLAMGSAIMLLPEQE